MKELRFHGEKIVTGYGALQYLEKITERRGMIVTGKSSMFRNGTIAKIIEILEGKGTEYTIFSGVENNPTTTQTMELVEKMKDFCPSIVISVGGGSAIDLAKVATVFYDHNLDFSSAKEKGIPQWRKTKFIAIPSTSGTATEVTKAAVITLEKEKIKIGYKSEAFVPDLAILDPEITLSMPQNIVAETGMDAMTHAVEAFINRNIDDFTSVLAKGAIEGLLKYLPLSYEKGDKVARGKVHNYQAMAGCAFTNVGLGMAHGISHAIGGMYNLAHGLINAVVLPYVLEFNSRDSWVKERLEELDKLVEGDFIVEIKKLNKSLDIPENFRQMGIDQREFEEDFPVLVENSLQGSTRVNPIIPSKEEMEKILKKIYGYN